MAERIRIEIGIEGSAGVNVNVESADADALEQALGGSGVVTLKTDDGTLTLAAAKVTYVRRHSRESRVGFGKL